jgi:NADH-quinone oxidoreductase subunit M
VPERLSGPWLLASIALPVIAAAGASALRSPRAARAVATTAAAGSLSLLSVAGSELKLRGAHLLVDPWDPGGAELASALFAFDELRSLLLPFSALLFAFVALAMPRAKCDPRGARRLLLALAATLALLAAHNAALAALLWAASAYPLFAELRARGAFAAARVFGLYMAASTALLLAGLMLPALVPAGGAAARATASGLLFLAVMIRKGIVPLHSWVPELFEHASLPSSIAFTAPQVGAYMAVAWALDGAPQWLLTAAALFAAFTALYGAGLTLVQDSPRRLFGWFFVSQSALVLVGLHCRTPLGLAGGLLWWLSSGLALAGFGMTLSALEARRGALSLRTPAGGYEKMPLLAVSFVLLGLASVGFPGTLGYVGSEALVEGAVEQSPWVGVAVIVATACNGITVMRAYFVLFCGAPSQRRESQRLRPRERAAFLGLVALLLAGGAFPGPLLASRHHVAESILRARAIASRSLPAAATAHPRLP